MCDGRTASFLCGDLARHSAGRSAALENTEGNAAGVIAVAGFDPAAVVAAFPVAAVDPGSAFVERAVPAAGSDPVVAAPDFACSDPVAVVAGPASACPGFASADQTWVAAGQGDLVCLSFDLAVHKLEWRFQASTRSRSN